MKGFIRQRGGGWELRVFVGTDAVTGKKRYATKTVRGGKREAQRMLAQMVTARDGRRRRSPAVAGPDGLVEKDTKTHAVRRVVRVVRIDGHRAGRASRRSSRASSRPPDVSLPSALAFGRPAAFGSIQRSSVLGRRPVLTLPAKLGVLVEHGLELLLRDGPVCLPPGELPVERRDLHGRSIRPPARCIAASLHRCIAAALCRGELGCGAGIAPARLDCVGW